MLLTEDVRVEEEEAGGEINLACCCYVMSNSSTRRRRLHEERRRVDIDPSALEPEGGGMVSLPKLKRLQQNINKMVLIFNVRQVKNKMQGDVLFFFS